MPSKNKIRTATRTFLSTVLLIYIFAIAVAGIALLVFKDIDSPLLIMAEITPTKVLIFQMLTNVIIVIPTLITIFRKKIDVKSTLRLNKFKFTDFILSLISLILIYPLISVPHILLQRYLGLNFDASSQLTSVIQGSSTTIIILSAIAIAIMPGIFEELQFRGLYAGCFKSMGYFKAALFSAFMFGLIHMNIDQSIYTFIMGFALYYILEATQSLPLVMILHALFNGYALLNLYIPSFSRKEAYLTGILINKSYVLPLVIFIIAGIVLAYIASRILGYVAKRNNNYDLYNNFFSRKEKTARYLLCPSFIIGVIGCMVIVGFQIYIAYAIFNF